MKELRQPVELNYRDQFGFYEDFQHYVTAQNGWTSGVTAVGGESVAVGSSGFGGTVVLTTGATAANEANITRTNKNFLFGNDLPLIFETNLSWTEASTNKLNFFAGFTSITGTGSMLQSGNAGPSTNFSGCGIYKKGNTNTWSVITSIGTVQTLTDSDTSKIPGAGVRNVLRIEILPVTATQIDVTFYLNGQQLRDQSSRNLPIRHQMVTFTGAAAMGCGVFAVAGAAASEAVTVDYVGAWQKRLATPITP